MVAVVVTLRIQTLRRSFDFGLMAYAQDFGLVTSAYAQDFSLVTSAYAQDFGLVTRPTLRML